MWFFSSCMILTNHRGINRPPPPYIFRSKKSPALSLKPGGFLVSQKTQISNSQLQRMIEAKHNRPIPKLFSNWLSASAASVFGLLIGHRNFILISCFIAILISNFEKCNVRKDVKPIADTFNNMMKMENQHANCHFFKTISCRCYPLKRLPYQNEVKMKGAGDNNRHCNFKGRWKT